MTDLIFDLLDEPDRHVFPPHCVHYSMSEHDLAIWKGLPYSLTSHVQIEEWFAHTYQAQVVDLQPGRWYVAFPDAERLLEFQLAWM